MELEDWLWFLSLTSQNSGVESGGPLTRHPDALEGHAEGPEDSILSFVEPLLQALIYGLSSLSGLQCRNHSSHERPGVRRSALHSFDEACGQRFQRGRALRNPDRADASRIMPYRKEFLEKARHHSDLKLHTECFCTSEGVNVGPFGSLARIQINIRLQCECGVLLQTTGVLDQPSSSKNMFL